MAASSEATFTLFLRLPIEIRTKVWEYHIKSEPQIAQLGVSRGRCTAPFCINKAITREAFDLHGFVSAKITPEHSTTFHLQVDMIYISRRSSELWGTSSLREVLQVCNALKKVRSVAFYFEVVKNERVDLLDSLRDCTSLETVFVILKERSENEEAYSDHYYLFPEHLAFDEALGGEFNRQRLVQGANPETEPDLFLKPLAFDNALGESHREDRTPKIRPGPQVTPDMYYGRERGLDYGNGGEQGDFIENFPRWFSNYLTHLLRDDPDYHGQT
jgi:hypothetical protein